MSQIHDILNPEVEKPQFFVIGKAFFGRKDVSNKDESYTSTLWMTFLNLPVMPYDTYRILNPQHPFFAKVYGLDEYILIKSIRVKMDWVQTIWTLITIYGSMVGLFYLDLFLFLDYGPAHGYGFACMVLLLYITFLIRNYRTPRNYPVHQVKQTPTPVFVPETKTIQFQPPQPQTVHESVAQAAIISTPVIEDIAQPLPVKSASSPKPLDIERPTVVIAAPVVEEPVKSKQQQSIAKPKIVAPKTEISKAPAQIKFDPNKIMESKFNEIDLFPKAELHPHEAMHLSDWLGFFIAILLLVQLITRFYFILNPDNVGSILQAQNIFDVVYSFYILSVLGIIFFILTIRRSPYIAYPLLILSLVFILRLNNYLYDYLINL